MCDMYGHILKLMLMVAWQVFVSNVTQGTQDAADIVLIVDESGSMRTEHEWLLVMIPLLEEMLVSEGVYNCNNERLRTIVGNPKIN